jgi:predicted Zn-dependent peptidase
VELAVQRADTEVRRTALDNGLVVVSEFMPGVRSVAVGAWVRRASVHEPPRLMGISHLLEHMVFKGTRHRSAREIALSLESLGGSLDAFTAREHTSFQARVLDEHLGAAAGVLYDLIFDPTLREADLELERKVVLEEIAMVEDTPDDIVFELHNAQLWGEHPYGYSILGTRDTVAGIGASDLWSLHSAAYRPQHIVLAAAGCVGHEQLLDTLDRTGWTAVRGGPSEIPQLPDPAPLPPRRVHVPRESQQTHVVIGSSAVAHSDRRRLALTIASLVLGGGMSSRLFQRVREELALAYSVYSFQSFYAAAGVLGVYVGTSPETAARALLEIENELRCIARDGLSEAELQAGKNQLKGQLTLSLESPASRMYRVAASELYGEPFETLDGELARVDQVTADEVAEVCATFLDPARQTVLTLGRAPGIS